MKKKTNPVAQLEADLRALIEPERVKFVELAFRHLKGQIDRFLEKRAPNRTFYDVFKFHNLALLPGLTEATDYREAETAMFKARPYSFTSPGEKRPNPDFEVKYRPDGLEQLRVLAQGIAESQIQTFLIRAMEKLGPVVERKPDFRVGKPEASATGVEHFVGRFEGGAWTGYLQFSWPDAVKFVAKLKIITNYSGKGTAYAQYPMTFHQAALDPQAEREGRSGQASIEQIWESVGYSVPKTPPGPPRKRWSKLVSGSVIEVGGRPVLIHTPGQVKKQGLPADAPQVARIEVWHSGASLERVDGTTARYPFTAEEKADYNRVEQDYDLTDADGKAKRMRRERAFQVFFAPVEA